MAGIEKIYVKSYEQLCQFRDWCKAHTLSDKYGVVKPLSFWLKDNLDEFDWSSGDSIPVFKGPYLIDYYLIKNCPFDYVQEAMRINYGSEYDKIKEAEGYYKDHIGYADLKTYRYIDYSNPGMHFTIQRISTIALNNKSNVKRNRPYFKRTDIDFKEHIEKNKKEHNKNLWNLNNVHRPNWVIEIYKDKQTSLSDELRFMMYTPPLKEQKQIIGTWNRLGDFIICDVWEDICNDCKTIKALTRRIRKWKLPVGTELRVFNINYPEDDCYRIIIKK